MNKKTIRDIDVKGKRVLVRVDFNVPLKDGSVADDRRIRAALPTIQYLLDQDAAVVLMSHLGRPKGEPKPEFRMDPVADCLSQLLGKPVTKLDDCVGPEVEAAVQDAKAGAVILSNALSSVENAGDAEVEGLDLDFTWLIGDRWTVVTPVRGSPEVSVITRSPCPAITSPVRGWRYSTRWPSKSVTSR